MSYSKATYTKEIEAAKVRPEWENRIVRNVAKIVKGRKSYESISKKTNVPWYVIGIIHMMEADCDFTKHLHNGDSLAKRTVQVPKGRPVKGTPPFTFEESALDALAFDGLTEVTDWSTEHTLYQLEKYNGMGPRNHGHPSAYLWSGTTNFTRGKYVTDGSWDPSAVSEQVGVWPMLQRLQKLEAETLPAKELKKVSTKLTVLGWAKNIITTVTGALGAVFSADSLGLFKSATDYVKDFGANHALVITVFGLAVAFVLFKWLESRIIQDHKEGRYVTSTT